MHIHKIFLLTLKQTISKNTVLSADLSDYMVRRLLKRISEKNDKTPLSENSLVLPGDSNLKVRVPNCHCDVGL